MAELKEVLEKEVTCPLCLDVFKEPKKLPCDHVYCKDCIIGLAKRSVNQSITCPECRTVTNIPNNDINQFPTAFRVNRLVEAFQMAQEDTDYHGQDSQTTSCTVHKAQPLAIYCETCRSLLCRDCVIKNREHVDHDYGYIEEVAEKYQEKNAKRLEMTKEYGEQLSQVHSQVSKVESTITSEETKKMLEIDCAFELLHNTLEESKRTMKKQLSQEYQSALGTVLKHKHRIESIQTETTNITELVDGALKGQNNVLFTQEDLIGKKEEMLKTQIKYLPFTVDEPSLPLPEVMSCETLQNQLDTCNFLYNPADPKKCLIKGDLLKRAEVGKSYNLTIDLVDSSGDKCFRGSQKLRAELRSCRDDTTTIGRIDCLSPGKFCITFELQKRGRNELNITVRGIQIANSPQSIYVHAPPSQLEQPVAEIKNLERPTGLTSCGSSLLAVEHSHNRIIKFNSFFKVGAVYGEAVLRGPSELTVDQQMNIYICTVQDHKVHKFTDDGRHIKSTGTFGTQPGQFNFPNGLRFNSRDELYVCDSENNRIQVFDVDLNLKRVFGGPGTGKSQFKFPTDVDFDSSDNIYVSDCDNHRIQVFTPHGQFMRIIGYKRFGSKELKRPVNIHISNDLLFVTEYQKSHVTVFKTSGELVTTFGKGILYEPEGIQVDIDGYVYVTSHCSKIFVF